MPLRQFLSSGLVVLSLILLPGCTPHRAANINYSSLNIRDCIDVVKDSRLADSKTPLRIPASVAVVFVPGEKIPVTTMKQAGETLKKQLLANPKYIRSVTVVPIEDVKATTSLQHIRELYDTDIAILLTFNQDISNQQSGPAAFFDYLVIGYFFVPGVETQTSTLIEGKIIHIPSNAMIFRESGSDQRSTHSTSHGEHGIRRSESVDGIMAATTDFGNSLSNVLTKFENYDVSRAIPLSTVLAGEPGTAGTRSNDYWEKVDTYKSSGGGSFGIIPLLIAMTLYVAARRRK